MATKLRRGQALIELAIGMVALILVVSALCGFAVFIADSLEAQNDNRGDPLSFTGKYRIQLPALW